MNSILNIGVDVGNYDTKTQHCNIASGYGEYESRPEISMKVLEYGGKYYVPDIQERMPYVADKTVNDRCLILTLFGIAEELIWTAQTVCKETGGDLQDAIRSVEHIRLGVGLPPGHFNAFSAKTLKYYEEKLEGVVSFVYRNLEFSFRVDTLRIFPQDFVAVYKNRECETAKKKRYYIIGIGGGTTDVIPVLNGQPDVNHCFSLEMGTRIMYKQISANVQRQYGEMLDEGLVEDVLRGNDSVLPEDMQALIKKDAGKHLDAIINGCTQQGVRLSLYPVVFYGGGALLLADYISNNLKLNSAEIIGDINANAKAYAACLGTK